MNQQYEFEIASTSKRIGAFFIDDLVIAFLVLGIFYEQLMGIGTISDPTQRIQSLQLFLNQSLPIFIAIKILYHTFFVWQNGKTLGKQVMRIKVIEIYRATHPTFGVAFLRASLRIVSEMLFFLGFIFAFFSPMVQTLHDKLAKCVVVDEK
jgi:uncharacterized RDD family membrane protein YckC